MTATPVKMTEPQTPPAIETGSPASTAATETVAAPTGKPTQKPTAALMVTQGARTERLSIFHRSGQTFLTWEERGDLQGERYRVYRSDAPITASNLAQAQFLYQVGKDSARFYANYYNDPAWKPRLSDRFIFAKGALKMKEGIGALVWTLAKKDFKGQERGKGYYAVTFTPKGGREVFSVDYTAGPLEEAVRDPLPVEITYTPDIHPGPGGHFYIQYMDLRTWNPTFHAPNPTNEYLGFKPDDPNLKFALAYAYDYSVFEPTEEMCGGRVPDRLPVIVYLHGWRSNRYSTQHTYDNPSCAYGVYPIDESETWYFGFAQKHDYRKGGSVRKGDVIANFTEQRVLRMVYDLLRDPPGPAADPQRVYLMGHSMGGSGALAFAERYPNVFAAVYSGQPLTNFRTSTAEERDWPADVAGKWGAPDLNLPIVIRAPGGWAAHLQKYNKVGVWDWQNLQASFKQKGFPKGMAGRAADEMAPLGIDHGSIDLVIPFKTQAQPLYPLINASGRTVSAAVVEKAHQWSNFGWLLPSLGMIDETPFWNYQVIKDETTPGFSFLSGNPDQPPTGPSFYNQTILWSASWSAWDGAPVDRPRQWQMSFCAVAAGSRECGTGEPQTVDITPRRLQAFQVTPGARYQWENHRVRDNHLEASGSVTAGANGLITVKGFGVSPEGSRLVIRLAGE